MTLNGKEYSKKFLEQLLMDVINIAECIEIDIEANIITDEDCDMESYTEFSEKYRNI